MSVNRILSREPGGLSPRIVSRSIYEDRVQVSWDQPEGGVVIYELETYEGARQELRATEWIAATPLRSCKFSGLNRETVYLFRIRAYYSDGTVGGWSEPKVGLAGTNCWGIRLFLEMEDAIIAAETVENSNSDTLCVVEDKFDEEDGTTVLAFFVHLNDAELMEDGDLFPLEGPDSGKVVWQRLSPACRTDTFCAAEIEEEAAKRRRAIRTFRYGVP